VTEDSPKVILSMQPYSLWSKRCVYALYVFSAIWGVLQIAVPDNASLYSLFALLFALTATLWARYDSLACSKPILPILQMLYFFGLAGRCDGLSDFSFGMAWARHGNPSWSWSICYAYTLILFDTLRSSFRRVTGSTILSITLTLFPGSKASGHGQEDAPIVNLGARMLKEKNSLRRDDVRHRCEFDYANRLSRRVSHSRLNAPAIKAISSVISRC
jgi:hypothetical protein